MMETPNEEIQPVDERLSEDEAHDMANMMKAVIKENRDKIALNHNYDISSEEYQKAYEAVEQVMSLAEKETDLTQFRKGLTKASIFLLALPPAAVTIAVELLLRAGEVINPSIPASEKRLNKSAIPFTKEYLQWIGDLQEKVSSDKSKLENLKERGEKAA